MRLNKIMHNDIKYIKVELEILNEKNFLKNISKLYE